MAACSREPKRVQALVPSRGGPYLTRAGAEAAISEALHLCVSSFAPPCRGECVARGSACRAVVDEWDAEVGPYYAAPAGGSGWYYWIPAGLWITYRHVPVPVDRVVTA